MATQARLHARAARIADKLAFAPAVTFAGASRDFTRSAAVAGDARQPFVSFRNESVRRERRWSSTSANSLQVGSCVSRSRSPKKSLPAAPRTMRKAASRLSAASRRRFADSISI